MHIYETLINNYGYDSAGRPRQMVVDAMRATANNDAANLERIYGVPVADIIAHIEQTLRISDDRIAAGLYEWLPGLDGTMTSEAAWDVAIQTLDPINNY